MKKTSILIAVLALSAAAVAAVPVARQAAASSRVQADLKLFWDCDVDAARSGIPSAACSKNFEDVKRVKFNGSFPELVKYWEANKGTEYAKRSFYYVP